MDDDSRDPQLLLIRAHWEPPAINESLDSAVLHRYRREFVRPKRIRHFWIPLIAAAVIALSIGIFGGVRLERGLVRTEQIHSKPGFVPVSRPRLTVVSEGERP